MPFITTALGFAVKHVGLTGLKYGGIAVAALVVLIYYSNFIKSATVNKLERDALVAERASNDRLRKLKTRLTETERREEEVRRVAWEAAVSRSSDIVDGSTCTIHPDAIRRLNQIK